MAKILLRSTASVLFVAAGLAFWVGGRAISEFAHVERIFAEFLGIVLAVVCAVIGFLLAKAGADSRHRADDTLPPLVIATRRPDGTPTRASCPACGMVFSTEAFDLNATFPHERKLNEWYAEHFKAIHAAQ